MVELEEGWLKKGIDKALKEYEKLPEWRKKMGGKNSELVELEEGWLKKGIDKALKEYEKLPEWRKKMGGKNSE